MSDDVEAELKFDLRKSEFDALDASLDLDAFSVDPPVSTNLLSVYYDTSDQRLRSAGLTLRVRKKNGHFEETLKSSAGTWSGLARRREITVDLDGPEPDLDALDGGEAAGRLRCLVGEEPLVPLFTVAVRRTVRMVETKERSRVEIALDGGEIRAGDKVAPIHEAEFELKAGSLSALFPVAKATLAAVPVRASAASKSDRGFRLIDGDGEMTPQKAGAIVYSSEASVEEVLAAVLASCLTQIVANIAVLRASDDPEGPHQLRVGLRRLLVALKLFSNVIDATSGSAVRSGAKALHAAVGELRDLDVLAVETVAACADHVDTTDLAALLDDLRAKRRRMLRDDLDGPETGAFLIDLLAFVEGRGWRSPGGRDQARRLNASATSFAEKAVQKRWHKTARKGRDPKGLSADERHALRKSFKSLRYALEFFGPLLRGKDVKRMLKKVRAAQDVLGYLNDARSVHALDGLLAGHSPRGAARRAAVERAVGYCTGWHEKAAEAVWNDAWKRVRLDPEDV